MEEQTGLREALEASYEETLNTETAPETATVETKTAETELATDSGRSRDDKGRFAPKATAATEPTENTAPWDWDKEAKADFAKLPPEAQAIITKRYSEQNKFLQDQKADLDRKYQENHDIHNHIEKNRDSWALRGLTPSQVIAQAIAFDNLLLTDPRTAIQSLAASNGIDLAELAQGGEEDQDPVDPVVSELRQEIQELRAWRSAQEQASQSYSVQSASNEISQFAQELDASGAPAHPHFDQVYSDMLPIVASMKQAEPHKPNRTILQEAYERAVWSNPTTRAALLNRESSKRIEEQKEKAAAFRRAGTNLNGAPGPGLTPTMPKDLRGQLEANWDNLFN